MVIKVESLFLLKKIRRDDMRDANIFMILKIGGMMF